MLATRLKGAGVTTPPVYLDDVFSTFLYSGTGATQSIVNSINVSANGGLVWLKQRSGTADHFLFDTLRGVNQEINSSTANAESTLANSLTAFNTNGFTVGSETAINSSGQAYVGWTFRECAKFFDVVTYTGTGVARTVAHNLGSVPGCIIVKSTTLGTDWRVYHRGANASPATVSLRLNSSAGPDTNAGFWNNTAPTATEFTVGTDNDVNNTGASYVAYVFAHDAGGFGTDGAQNAISCGSYTGNGSNTGPTIALGYEPQWLLIKDVGPGDGWVMTDNTRGFVHNGGNWTFQAQTSTAETSSNLVGILSNGFRPVSSSTLVNANGSTYIYIAIRRSNKPPTVGTEVFTPFVYTGTNADNRLVNAGQFSDFILARQRNSTTVDGMIVGLRTVLGYLVTGLTSTPNTDADSLMSPVRVATADYGNSFSTMTGFGVGNDATAQLNVSTVANNQVAECFKRAVGFLDVVNYNGTGANRTVPHNLQAVPELMIVKILSPTTANWAVYYGDATKFLLLNTADLPATSSAYWNNTAPTSSVFSLGTNTAVNNSLGIYVAILFATKAGISKVGTYTGNGTSQTIDCGFTTGARFILIKSISVNADNWYVFDSARGIVAGNDPSLKLDSTGAEDTGDDSVDPDNSGFIIVQNAGTELNTSGQDYLFLAVA